MITHQSQGEGPVQVMETENVMRPGQLAFGPSKYVMSSPQPSPAQYR